MLPILATVMHIAGRVAERRSMHCHFGPTTLCARCALPDCSAPRCSLSPPTPRPTMSCSCNRLASYGGQYTNRPRPFNPGTVQQQPRPQPPPQIYKKPPNRPLIHGGPGGHAYTIPLATILGRRTRAHTIPMHRLHGYSALALVIPMSRLHSHPTRALTLPMTQTSWSPHPGSHDTIGQNPRPLCSDPHDTHIPIGMNTHVGTPAPLYQPSPVHARQRHVSTSPFLAAATTHMVISGASDEGRMSISIDFGTSFISSAKYRPPC